MLIDDRAIEELLGFLCDIREADLCKLALFVCETALFGTTGASLSELLCTEGAPK
jgi:hypothetical protein